MGLTKAQRHNRMMDKIYDRARELRTITVTIEFSEQEPLWLEANWPGGVKNYVQGLLPDGFTVTSAKTHETLN